MAKVFLIGMPGSGKSTIGKLVADQLSTPFYDLDSLIESEVNETISEIFETRGEQYFRETERKLLHSTIADTPNFIMATGGGTPCFYDNIMKMNEAGLTIFIDPPLKVILDRLSSTDIQTRPKLKDLNLEHTIHDTYKYRKPFYSKASYALEGNNATKEALVTLINSIV